MSRKQMIVGSITLLVGIFALDALIKPPDQNPFEVTEHEKTLLFAIDTTESMDEKLPVIWPYMVRCLDKFERAGSNDKVIIAQITGEKGVSLLWEGSPHDLREKFGTVEVFTAWILSKQDKKSGNSRVFDGLADALNYSMTRGGRVITVACTDMEENVNPIEGEKRLLSVLREYGSKGHILGLYWVHPNRVDYWSNKLKLSGIKHSACESWILDKPLVPEMD